MNQRFGPKSLFLYSFCILAACGSGEHIEETSTAKPVSWESVASILEKSCAGSGSGCHNQTTAQGDYNFLSIAENEFRQSQALGRLQDAQSPMPPTPGSAQNPAGIALSDDDRLTIIKFLSQ